MTKPSDKGPREVCAVFCWGRRMDESEDCRFLSWKIKKIS
jgi:hypothetical protein